MSVTTGRAAQGDRPIENLPRLSVRREIVYFCMRLLPFVWLRRAVSHLLAQAMRLRRGSELWFDYPTETCAAHLQSLRRTGLTEFGQLVSPDHIAEIQAFLRDKSLVTPDGRRLVGAEPAAGATIASYPVRTVLECPHIIELMNSPQALAIASAYLGCMPTISGLRIDWSSPSDGPVAEVQQFHRDYDDWRFVKLFVYLTDVSDTIGPHEYVLTSHRRSGRLYAKPYEREYLERKYGRSNLHQVLGCAGTGFMADTWGIHKGNVPKQHARIMLQIQYSILPVLRFDYQPVSMRVAVPIDRFINRLLIS